LFKTDIQIDNKSWPILGSQEVSLTVSIQADSPDSKIPVKDLLLTFLERLPNIYQAIESGRINNDLQFSNLQNLRGRPAETFNDNSLKSNQEELIFISGSYFDEDAKRNKKEENLNTDFQIRLKTEFVRFKKDKITYRITPEFNEQISGLITGQKIPEFLSSNPITISNARFGIEVFKPAFFGSMVGIFPKISTRYYLELSERKCSLFYNYPSSDSPTDNSGDPLGIIKTLDGLFRSFKLEDNLLQFMPKKTDGK
jgi:hypothetical protein